MTCRAAGATPLPVAVSDHCALFYMPGIPTGWTASQQPTSHNYHSAPDVPHNAMDKYDKKALKTKRKKPITKKDVTPTPLVMRGESREKKAARAKLRKGKGSVFVYEGAGKKHNKDAALSELKCENLTVRVQWCLAKNDYKQDTGKCQAMVKLWKECTEKWDSLDHNKINREGRK